MLLLILFFSLKSDTDSDKLFVVSADAGLQHRVLSPPARRIFHYDRTVATEIVELSRRNVLSYHDETY